MKNSKKTRGKAKSEEVEEDVEYASDEEFKKTGNFIRKEFSTKEIQSEQELKPCNSHPPTHAILKGCAIIHKDGVIKNLKYYLCSTCKCTYTVDMRNT